SPDPGTPSSATSSAWCSNRSCSSRPAACTGSKRCCAGTARSRVSSSPPTSCPWRSRPVSSCPSAPGCSRRHAVTRDAGRTRCPRPACRYARRWQDALPASAPLRVSVNLSAKQFAHPGLVHDVRTALQDAGLAPSRLALEISESVLMANVESSAALLLQLRELGVELHMDDFGTGYSSLSDLPRLPLQGIKVERSFVRRTG